MYLMPTEIRNHDVESPCIPEPLSSQLSIQPPNRKSDPNSQFLTLIVNSQTFLNHECRKSALCGLEGSERTSQVPTALNGGSFSPATFLNAQMLTRNFIGVILGSYWGYLSILGSDWGYMGVILG